jgi:type IV secretory pathway protease TraF
LAKDDRMIAAMGPVRALQRGQIILFRVHDWIYVQRVAALPGDRVAMRDGIVLLNGTPVAQRAVGEEIANGPCGPTRVRRLAVEPQQVVHVQAESADGWLVV